jgi:hypothetical protein
VVTFSMSGMPISLETVEQARRPPLCLGTVRPLPCWAIAPRTAGVRTVLLLVGGLLALVGEQRQLPAHR